MLNGFSITASQRMVAGGWEDPKGGSFYSLDLHENATTPSAMAISANWTELEENIGYSVEMIVPYAELSDVTVVESAVSAILIFGPDGYFEVATDAPPDESGQYNGRIVKITCGIAGVGLTTDHWIWSDTRYLGLRFRDTDEPRTNCTR